MFTDYKVSFLENDGTTVELTSREFTKMTGGIFKLCQKVIHGLLTNSGDDFYDQNWGGNLLDIFSIPIDDSDNSVNMVFLKCRTCVDKVQNDIISIQNSYEKNANNTDAFLESLELISVIPDVINLFWKVKIKVISVSGEELSFSLP